MTSLRLLAIGLIFLCTAAAWSVLGGTVVGRTGQMDGRLSPEVAQLWGGQHVQVAPQASVRRPRQVEEQVQGEDATQSAAVIGGGFIGLEMAENLTRRGIATTVLELLDQVLPPLDYEMASPLHAHLTAKGVRLELENGLAGIARRGERLLVETQKGDPIECDMVLLSIGVRPETKLARGAGLTIGPLGGIQVDAGMHTSDPDILLSGMRLK